MKKTLLIILALAAVVGAGFTGWTFWQNQKDKKTNNQAQEMQSDTSENDKYVVIKEWGVRFEAPESLRQDLIHSVNGDEAIIGSKRFSSISTECGVQSGARGIAGILRKQEKASTDLGYSPVKTINGFDYYTTPSPGACVSDQSYFTELSNVRISISEAIKKTLQPE